MDFQVRCPGCQHSYRLHKELLGKLLKCPKCARTFRLKRTGAESSSTLNAVSAPATQASAAVATALSAPPADTVLEASSAATTDPALPAISEPESKEATPDQLGAQASVGTAPASASLPPTDSSLTLSDLITLLLLPEMRKLLAVAAAGIVLLWFIWSLFFASGLAYPSGKVTLNAAPLAEARVTFTGDDGKAGPFIARTDARGRYTLLSNTATGIPAGKYRVTVHKVGLKDGTIPTDPQAYEEAVRAGTMESLVNQIYETFETTPLRAEVASGSNTRDFDLK